MVWVIPSRIEDKMVVLMQVITHAQARDQMETIMEDIDLAPTKSQKQKSWRERQAKMVAKKFESKTHQSTKPLQLVHSDVMRKISTPTYHTRCIYAICFVDDYSGYTKVYLMHTKDEALDMMKRFRAEMAKIVPEHEITALQTDNGGEYLFGA